MTSPDNKDLSAKITQARAWLIRKRFHITWILPLAGFIFGLVSSQRAAGGFVFGFIGFMLSLLILVRSQPNKSGGSAFSRTSIDFFDNAFVVLIAAIIKADQKVTPEELEVVEKKLKKDYFFSDYKRLAEKLKTELAKEKIDIELHARFVEEEFSASEKVNLLHLLVKIALADRFLTQSEELMLQQIAAKIGIPYRTLDSLLAIYRFTREQTENKQQRTKTVSVNQLENAYKILEIDASATHPEIKKAYKKLAIVHHPDKVAHLGEYHQKAAAEKFKIIVGAYDLICKKKGIV
jgi:DnaJ like chaperone protein